jgi:uncharacterized membrane-anchored protein
MRATMIAKSVRCYHMAQARPLALTRPLQPPRRARCRKRAQSLRHQLPGVSSVNRVAVATPGSEAVASKVPEVTLGFWIIKVAATTLGETGGDTLSMTLGIGYLGGSLLLLACVLGSLALWYRTEGTVSVNTVNTPRVEAFYWLTITFSQTLGTALGDWVADAGLGYRGGALVFGALLILVAIAYYRTRISHVVLFWTAFILTRPLGATIGDFFDKPIAQGGLNVSRPLASAILAVFIIVCILLIPQRAGSHPRAASGAAPGPGV